MLATTTTDTAPGPTPQATPATRQRLVRARAGRPDHDERGPGVAQAIGSRRPARAAVRAAQRSGRKTSGSATFFTDASRRSPKRELSPSASTRLSMQRISPPRATPCRRAVLFIPEPKPV